MSGKQFGADDRAGLSMNTGVIERYGVRATRPFVAWALD